MNNFLTYWLMNINLFNMATPTMDSRGVRRSSHVGQGKREPVYRTEGEECHRPWCGIKEKNVMSFKPPGYSFKVKIFFRLLWFTLSMNGGYNNIHEGLQFLHTCLHVHLRKVKVLTSDQGDAMHGHCFGRCCC